MNKREFVCGGVTALAGLAGGAPAVAADAGAMGCTAASPAAGLLRQRLPDLATDMRLAAWQAYVGHRFTLPGAASAGAIALDGAVARACQPGFEQFSLYFVAADGADLRSGTHALRHATGQRIAVYLEAVESGPLAQRRYRADFNLSS